MNAKHESIDDIPLIIGFCNRLRIQSLIDEHFKTHGNQEGLSNGKITLGWIAHILTQNNHCKSPVEQWQKKHNMTLQALLEEKVSDTDFEDCRLGRLLEKLSDDFLWHSLEESFYKDSFSVLQLNTNAPESFKESPSIENGIKKTIKIDATTAYGYHEIIEGGIMQRGWSKDDMPAHGQLKIMVSVEGNTGVQIASDVVPGNENDDPLYVPTLKRTRKIVDTANCLMCGDCKMSALYIRADIVENGEFYLAPLQLNNLIKKLHRELVDNIVEGNQSAQLITHTDDKDVTKIIGAGFEITREQVYQNEDKSNSQNETQTRWNERILLIRSYDHVEHEIASFNKKNRQDEG